jgi:DNA-binding LytR/AlgR family response regulator
VAAKLLRWFEEKLPEQFFTRVHRTHLVNKKFIVSIKENNILLQSGVFISISRRKKKKVFRSFISPQRSVVATKKETTDSFLL